MMKLLKKDTTLLFILFSIAAASYFSKAIQNLLVGVIAIQFLLFFRKNLLQLDWKIVSLIGIPFFLTLISVFQSENMNQAQTILSLRAPIIGLSIITFSININKEKLVKVSPIYILSSFIACLITLTKGILLFNHNGVFFHPNFTPHFTIIHHPYFAAYAFLAFVLLSVYFYSYQYNKTLKTVILIVLGTGILLSAARIVQLIFIVFIFFQFYSKYLKGRAKLFSAILLLTSAVGISILFTTVETFKFKYTQDLTKSSSPRMIIWENAFEIIEESAGYFSSVGIGDLQEKLNHQHELYMKNTIKPINIMGYNTHNQYLEFILTNGWIGLIYLISMLYICYLLFQSRNIASIFYGLLLLSFLFTECLLNRQYGVYFIACFLPLFTNLYKNESIEKNKH